MSMTLRKEDFDALFVAAPAPEWTAAFEAVEKIEDFKRLVDAFETETKFWIIGTRKRFKDNFDHLLEAVRSASPDYPMPDFEHLFEQIFPVVEAFLRAHETPFHDRPGMAKTMSKMQIVSGAPARFVRKQLRKIEDIRVERYNAMVDLYYGLLAARSELIDDHGSETYSDPRALGDDLRKLIA